jgi:uncharacterized protein (DUF305 family)
VKRLLILLAVGVVTACGQQEPAAVEPLETSRETAQQNDFGTTEQAFVQLAISTDDQAVKLLDLGAARAANPALRTFAGELAAARRAELTELHGLLENEEVPYQNLHKGHDMPGMPTEQELAALTASRAFDTDLTRLVRAHLTESTTVARSAASQVKHPATRTVASRMVDERAAALARLDTLS